MFDDGLDDTDAGVDLADTNADSPEIVGSDAEADIAGSNADADIAGSNVDADPVVIVLLLPLLLLAGLSCGDMLVLLCLSVLFAGELVDGVVVGSSLLLVLLVVEGLGSSGLTNRVLSPLSHTVAGPATCANA